MTLTIGERLAPATERPTGSDTIRVGVIGYGYWGPNLVRNFAEIGGSRVVAVSDLSTQRLAEVRGRYPSVKTTTDYRDLLSDTSIDAVVIATPVRTHADLALEALRAGKHVLVEKPLAASLEEARELLRLASDRSLLAM